MQVIFGKTQPPKKRWSQVMELVCGFQRANCVPGKAVSPPRGLWASGGLREQMAVYSLSDQVSGSLPAWEGAWSCEGRGACFKTTAFQESKIQLMLVFSLSNHLFPTVS